MVGYPAAMLQSPSEPPADGAPAAAVRPGPDPRTAQVARRRAVVGLIAALLVAGGLTWAVAAGDGAPLPLDQRLTDVTRGWADAAGWPVGAAHVIGLVTAPFWSALAVSILVIALVLAGYRAAAGLLALSGLAGVTSQ